MNNFAVAAEEMLEVALARIRRQVTHEASRWHDRFFQLSSAKVAPVHKCTDRAIAWSYVYDKRFIAYCAVVPICAVLYGTLNLILSVLTFASNVFN